MKLSQRTERVAVALERVPRQSPRGDLPDELVPYALELRDAHAAVEHAREHASRDELDSGLFHRLSEDAFYAAHRFGIELYRWEGRDVSAMEAQLVGWLSMRDVEDAVSHAERIRAVTVPEPEEELIPEPIRREVQQAIDNRRAMRQALGRPSQEHRDWSELLGGRSL